LSKSEAGTSLLELMLAMAAGLIVLGSTLQSLSFVQRHFSSQQVALSQAQDLRLGLELLQQELRLAEPNSLSILGPNEVEFRANIHGLMTRLSAAALPGQKTLSVEDGSGWPERKTVLICWNDQCDTGTLARDGQRAMLTLTQPLSRSIPPGASVTVLNRIRYYSRNDEQGVPRFLRQVDGGAGVLVGDIRDVRFSYWDERGHATTQSALVKRIVVEVDLPRHSSKAVREISLRT
jgi:hypothetical protein